METPVGVAVIGAGYWGPNLIRNFRASPSVSLRWVCDLDVARASQAIGEQSDILVTDSVEHVLADESVEGIAIATPAATHGDLGLRCIQAGKHLLVEKPLAETVEVGERLVEDAASAGLVLMTDHTYCYTASVSQIRDVVASGDLGELHYYDSTRVNLGLIQDDIDVFWDLAPHDLSILDFILPEGTEVTSVTAQGADPLGIGQTCVGFASLTLSSGAIAHINVNWLSPTKIRRTIVGGSERMIVWDDLRPGQRVSIYDSGVDLTTPEGSEERRDLLVSYRVGTMEAPALREVEALRSVVEEFASSIRGNRPPLTDGQAGLRVLRALDAIDRSLAAGCVAVPMDVS